VTNVGPGSGFLNFINDEPDDDLCDIDEHKGRTILHIRDKL